MKVSKLEEFYKLILVLLIGKAKLFNLYLLLQLAVFNQFDIFRKQVSKSTFFEPNSNAIGFLCTLIHPLI